jgi:hypothetical protein
LVEFGSERRVKHSATLNGVEEFDSRPPHHQPRRPFPVLLGMADKLS